MANQLSFPTSPTSGQRFLSNIGVYYTYDGYSWVSWGRTPYMTNLTQTAGEPSFLFRTIYTRGYMHCGYQGGSPWRNTNRTIHNTDTTTNLGDMMDNTGSYLDGGFTDYNTFVFNDSGGVGGTSSYTSSMSMITETLRTHNSNRDLRTSRSNCKTLMNPGLTLIYITGGNQTNTDKYSAVTDTMLTVGGPDNGNTSGGTGGGLSGFWGQYFGVIDANSAGAYLSWGTETWTSLDIFSGQSSTDGQPKGLSSKWGFGYNAPGTYNGSSTLYKFNDVTLSYISGIGRPESCGEENWQVGQDWGYSLGSYNGGNQTNNTQKVYYTTDTISNMGSTTQPKGHGGASSGACGTGSVTLLGGSLGG